MKAIEKEKRRMNYDKKTHRYNGQGIGFLQ